MLALADNSGQGSGWDGAVIACDFKPRFIQVRFNLEKLVLKGKATGILFFAHQVMLTERRVFFIDPPPKKKMHVDSFI